MDRRVAAVAEDQNGLISAAQLHAAGIAQPAVDNRVARGRLYVVHRGVVGRASFEVDFLFAEQRVIVEADGDRYHGTRLARERDAAKQAALEGAGYRVLRLTWGQATREVAQTVQRLRRALPSKVD